jgi:hypothetical protein
MHRRQQVIFPTPEIRLAKEAIKESSDSVRDQRGTKPPTLNWPGANEPSKKHLNRRAFVQSGKTEINRETRRTTSFNKKQDDMQEIIGNLWEHKKDRFRVHFRITGQQWGRTDFKHKNSAEQSSRRGSEAVGTAADRNGGDGGITGRVGVHWGIGAIIQRKRLIKVEFFSSWQANNLAGI